MLYYLIRILSGFFSPNAAKDMMIPEDFAYRVNTLPDESSNRKKSNKAPSVQLNFIYN